MMNSQENSIKTSEKKPFIIAASVICTLMVLLIAVWLLKNPVLFSVAQKKAVNEDFISAEAVNKHCSGTQSDLLADYLDLRIDIDLRYPQMLTDFDSEVFFSWSERAASISENSSAFSQELASQVKALEYKLSVASARLGEYNWKQSDIESLLDIFAEINRLYTPDESGKNTAFSVAEELQKISEWEALTADLSAFAQTLPNGSNVYLLSYLIKEAQGECTELRNAMGAVLSAGYSETDRVRLSGQAQKSYPSIQSSSGSAVNLLQKEAYIKFMYAGVCRALVEYIGDFYTG